MFSKNKNSKDGYKNYCKKCASEQNKRYRQRHREKINKRNQEWYYDTKNKKEERTKKELIKGYRVCTHCNEKKNIHNFYKRGNGGFYGECKECHNNKIKIYVEENKDVVLSRKRSYYKRTRDQQLAYFKEYNLLNSEKNVTRAKEWVKNNPEKARINALLARQRRLAKENKVKSNFTREDWKNCKEFFTNQKGNVECAYCNKEMKNATQDHFIPLNKGGNYTPNNILPVCRSCNSQKSASNFYEWYPRKEFYNKENILKIERYFNLLKRKQDNHEPSTSETV